MREKGLTLAAVLATLVGCTTVDPVASPYSTLDKVASVDERYQSYNVEMVEITGGRFWAPFGGPPGELYRMRGPVDLSNPRLRALAGHLGPAYMRVSGTWANSTYLPLEGETLQEAPDGFKQVLKRDQWRGVVEFAKSVDARIVTSFPASSGARNADGSWNPDQAQRLLDLTREAGGEIYGAELFNEPTLPQHGAFPEGYSAQDFDRDLRIFRDWAADAAPNLKLSGPGGTAEGTMLKHSAATAGIGGLTSEDLMQANPGILDIVTYHHYGTVSLRCGAMPLGGIDKALSPEFLELTAIDADFYGSLRDKYEAGKPLWLNETAQAACGGSPWAASFIDSFRYLNQLGVLAHKGVQVVAHNTLAASDYGLIDQDTLSPRPNYWAAVLWRRLMDTTVLESPAAPSPDVRMYAQCLRGSNGGVAMLALNLGEDDISLDVGSNAQVWVMKGRPLDTKMIEVNGAVPTVTESHDLAGLEGKSIKGQLIVPGRAIAFVAVNDAQNSSCI